MTDAVLHYIACRPSTTRGGVYANADHRHEAMAAYTRAKDFAYEVDAPYSVGLLYAQMVLHAMK